MVGYILEYASAFQLLTQDPDWNEPALVDPFLEGLKTFGQALGLPEITQSVPLDQGMYGDLKDLP